MPKRSEAGTDCVVLRQLQCPRSVSSSGSYGLQCKAMPQSSGSHMSGLQWCPHWWYVVLVTLLLLPGFWTLFDSCLLVKSTSSSFHASQKFSFIPRELDAAAYNQRVWLAHHFSLCALSLTLVSVLSSMRPDPDSPYINLSLASDLSLHCPLP